ncbi:hypothetical protein, partial [Fluviicola sp.]|uniref:hypothetical protein n=1 Tax=Fluviicola sp. TaxID=1917219 RepID=UPI0028353730
MKKLLYILICITALSFGSLRALAQTCDPNFTVSTSVTPSTCLSNGKITVTLGGNTANLFGMQYSLSPVSGTTFVIAPQSSNVLSSIPPGTYKLTVRAFCSVDPGFDVTKTVNNVVVGGNYTVPVATLNFTASRKSYSNCSTGKIALNVTGGVSNGAFSFTITSAPAGVAVPQTVTATKSGTVYTLAGGNWPSGNYTMEVADSCYTSAATFYLDTVAVSMIPPTSSNSPGYISDDRYNQYGFSCNSIFWSA